VPASDLPLSGGGKEEAQAVSRNTAVAARASASAARSRSGNVTFSDHFA
jgi:hypothetical protein